MLSIVMKMTIVVDSCCREKVFMMMVKYVVNGDEDDNCNDAFSDL